MAAQSVSMIPSVRAHPGPLSASASLAFTGLKTGCQLATPASQKALAPRLSVRCASTPRGFVPEEHKWLYDDVEKLGPDVWNRTYYPKGADHLNVEKKWFVVDASNKRLGRLASAIAVHIRGKTEPTYTPSIDMGSYVVVVNAEKVEVTGKKRLQKLYRRHSGRPGGMKVETFDQLQSRIPERIIEHAVKGMLPKGRLGRQLFTHLKVYQGPEHPHEAQTPLPLPLTDKHIEFASASAES